MSDEDKTKSATRKPDDGARGRARPGAEPRPASRHLARAAADAEVAEFVRRMKELGARAPAPAAAGWCSPWTPP